MELPEFNLLDEPWIRVLKSDCSEEEVSLKTALLYSQEYCDLCGETPEQDMAILRVMLAVLLTVFSRKDEFGNEAELETPEDAQIRWLALWKMEKFPQNVVDAYLEEVHERFWLFHETYPFWQVSEAAIGTEYTAAKLNGELSESGNKVRLFPLCGEKKKRELSYAEAARWLLYVNAYDDTSAKPKEKGLPSTGTGWLGKLGLIAAVGKNLFETLMLNMTFLKDGKELWEEENQPIWERKPSTKERRKIAVPENPAELLTLQSRRLFLKREHGRVTGYYLLGGDFFDKERAFEEQMTVWREVKQEYFPRRHDPSRQMWRDFGSIFIEKDGEHMPGVVSWSNAIAELLGEQEEQIKKFRIVSVQYGDKDFFVNDTFSDSLAFHADLLLQINRNWQERILNEIGKCENAANIVGDLAIDLALSNEQEPKTTEAKKQFYDRARRKGKEQFFSRIDRIFREWLRGILPEKSDLDETCENLERDIKNEAGKLGKEMLLEAGETAYIGRENNNSYYAAPKVYNLFWGRLRKLYG